MAKANPAGSGRIGRYALVDRLAIGGMAEVFLAREVDGLDRLVVVKRMLPALAEDAEFVSMFLREAQIVARISHPNVVQILERGEADGLPFFAMEYVPGVSLKELVKAARLKSGLLPLGLVVHILAQACAGAHAAHELRLPTGEPVGLVHRDLTPHNLMVDDQAHVKLLDFGIAKDTAVDGATRTGVLRGKISYLSPEQALQLPLDRRTDVFALGVCAYELITLDRPFTMQSEAQTLQRIVDGRFRPLGDLRPDVPLGLADVVHRALSRDHARRWPTAEAFRVALKTEALACGIDDDADSARRALRPILGTMITERNAQLYAAIQRVGPGNATLSLYGVSGSTGLPIDRPPRTPWMAPVLAGAGLAAGVAVSVAGLVSAAGMAAWWTLTGPSGPPLAMTFAPVHSADTVLAEHAPIVRYLEARLDRPIVADVAGSYADAVSALGSGEAALAVLPGKAVEHALAEVPGVEVLAWKVVDGSAESQGLLLVASDSRAASLDDLRGETVCLTDPDSVTGWELPMRYAREQGIDLTRELTVHASGNHEKALTDLLAGTCAVAATYSGNLMTANERGIPVSRLKILVPTGTTPNDAIVAGPAADVALRDAVREALASFEPARDAGVARVGAVERITGFRLPRTDGGVAPGN
ncbi:MAG: PhnD/SsuA/transferrin family substrate-binding protein [Deltaproteobacteria bacterium]|nr:PhnD/SsuA/transferrin family substrate-binding protein [Deltaproteobacteria bacterium]